MTDPYIILNVPSNATEEEIKRAYRKIAMETHPDKNGGDPKKTAFFRDATDAYHFLLDKAQRESYDWIRSTQSEDYSDTFYTEKKKEYKAQSARTEAELHREFMAAKESAKDSLHDIWINILFTLAGAAIGGIPTLISYMNTPPGGYYHVYYGPILIGAIGVLKGLWGLIVALGDMYTAKAKEKRIF